MTLPATLDVFSARRRLQDYLQPAPLRSSLWLSEVSGATVFAKLEALNLTGSFKIRGAFNAVLTMIAHGARAPLVVTASAGNHGRAIALVCEQLGLGCTVFTPTDAPAAKKDGVRRHGAHLVDDNADYDLAERRAREFAKADGRVFISPYNHPDVIAGAGTIGLEIVEALPRCDIVIVPIGGGGLASGIGLALRAVAPHVEFVGVEVENSAPFTRSLEAGRIVEISPHPSLADGLTGNLEPDTITFPLVKQFVNRVVLVSEEEVADAMRGLGEHEHLIVEGAGAVAAAALASHKIEAHRKTVAVLVTGGNVDLSKWIAVVTDRESKR